MSYWTRSTPLTPAGRVQRERWCFREPQGEETCFEIAVTTGKPLDVMALKNTSLRELRDYASFLSRTAEQLYGQDEAKRVVARCPCCDRDTTDAPEALRIFGIAYCRCAGCGHAFVGAQPSKEAINRIFSDSDEHSQTYVDRETTEIRLQQVITPKIDWVLDIYADAVGGFPTSCIDVGAGGGHFVEGMRRRGLDTVGYELSKSSRDFARQAFGIDLTASDFLTAKASPADIITMWGLLEYTAEPRRFLSRARQRFADDHGLLVIEVPRFDALGTAAQAANPSSVARHMDPTSHLNCFTEESLATALVAEGFHPVAAWYFGMDAYELLVQSALRLDDERIITALADMIPALQSSCDAGRQCDDLIMAAIPTCR